MPIPQLPAKCVLLSLLLCAGFCLVGCGSSMPPANVSGKVTLEGKPLSNGQIVFVPKTIESGPHSATTIQSGTYRLSKAQSLGVGEYQVMIYADQPLPFAIDNPQEFLAHRKAPLPKNSIPARYNRKSELHVVTREGSNTFDFDLSLKETARPKQPESAQEENLPGNLPGGGLP